MILARNSTTLCHFSFSLFLSFRLSRGDQGRAKRECRDRSKGHRVPPARSILPLRFVPFFLVIRISINLVVVPAGFFLCACVIAADARELLVARCWEGPCRFFPPPLFRQVHPCRKKLYANGRFSFLTYFTMHWRIHRIVSREGCVTDQSVACRAFITPRHIALFPRPRVI